MQSEREEFLKMGELRELKNENENIENEIIELSNKCFDLKGDIENMKEKLEETNKELEYRYSKLEKLKNDLNSLDSLDKNENVKTKDKKNVIQIQSSLTRRNFERIFGKFLPEWDNCFDKQDKYFYQKDHLEDQAFSNLFYKNVFLVFQYFEISKISNETVIKSEKQSFLISKYTTFKQLKVNACNFWSLSDPSIFIITDQLEGIIHNEDTLVEQFLREYSINMNEFKLTIIHRIRNKVILDNKNEQIIQLNNQINQKKKENNISKHNNISEMKFLNKIKSFFLKYPRLREYSLNNGDEKKIDFSNSENQAFLKKENLIKINRETSFIKLVIFLIILLGTSIFISNSRSLIENYENSKNIISYFDNKKVDNLEAFFNYTVVTLGYQFFFEEFDGNKTYLENFNESFIEPFKILGYGDFIKNKSNITPSSNFLNKNNELIDIKNIYKSFNQKMNNEFIIPTDLTLIISKVNPKSCTNSMSVKNIIDLNEKCYSFYHYPNTFTNEELISLNIEEEETFITKPKPNIGNKNKKVLFQH